MCESVVFLDEKGQLTEVMPDVARIDVVKNKVICLGLLGEREEFEGVQIIEANLMEHKIVLGRL
ncbi:MAG: CooT family nickel-binding protein [Methanomassiliicoccales archaeon]|nr:MAG: CooT family nickel-binding protein [Methanomassiliicoccales archaeon]